MKPPIALIALALVALPAAATSIEADVEAGVTQCGFYLDAATVPTLVTATAGKCRFVVTGVAVGPHSVAADARRPGVPPWSSVTEISAKSAPFAFTKPGATGGSPPSNFVLVP